MNDAELLHLTAEAIAEPVWRLRWGRIGPSLAVLFALGFWAGRRLWRSQ